MEHTIDMTSILKTLESFEEKQFEKESKDGTEKCEKKEIILEPEFAPKSEEMKEVVKKESTLTEILEDLLKNSKLNHSLYLKGDEVVTYSATVKKLSINGKVSKAEENELNQLQNKVAEIITEKIGQNFNVNEFWRATSGIKIGDKFEGLDCFNINGDQIRIEAEKGKALIIDIWGQKPGLDLSQYFEIKNLTMEEIFKNTDGLNLDSISFIGLCGEENFSKWKEIVNFVNIEKHIKQYQCKKVYNEFGVNNCLPALIVVDSEGIVRFVDNYCLIDFEESLKNFSQGKNEVLLRSKENDENPNAWWNDMDSQTKMDIVRDINLSLRELGCNNTTFVVNTQYTHKDEKVTAYTIPTFTGNVFETEYEILQNYAVELQNNWNFNNFEFNCKVIVFGHML
jgi:hypothetical protein